MNTKVTTLAALLLSVLLSNVQEVAAQQTRHPAPQQRDRRRRRRSKHLFLTPARQPQQLRQPARATRMRWSKK